MSKREKIFYLIIFIFYLVLFSLSPISGDDWGNYFAGSNGLYHSIGNAVGMYFSWEGRFVSRILINILTYHKVLWNITNAFIVTLLSFISIKIVNPRKSKLPYLLILLLIPFMNIYMFSQTMVWLAGNITYFLEIPFILIYFYLLYKDKYNTKISFSFLILLSICIPMFVEHMALILILGNIIILGYKYYKTKTLDKKIIVLTFISIISTLSMLLSPGTKTRSLNENTQFNKLSIFGKISYNIPAFIYYTFMDNYYLLFLWIISNYYLVKHNLNNKPLKLILILVLTIVPIITMFLYPYSIFKNFNIINNTYLIVYYILYSFISFFLLLKEQNKESIFLFVIGIGANIVMLMSPTWGYRTTLFTYITLSISCIIIIAKYFKKNLLIENIFKCVSILSFLLLMVFYINVFRCQKDLEKSIKNQLRDKKETIVIPLFPNYANCNINPDNEFHLKKYKEYYNIPENTNIEFTNDKWHHLIFYKK